MTWADVLDKYGIPSFILMAVGYAVYKFFIPIVISQYERQQKFLYGEIERLNREAKEDRDTLLTLIKQNNETNSKLQITLENLTQQIERTQKDISTIYQLVEQDKRVIKEREHGV